MHTRSVVSESRKPHRSETAGLSIPVTLKLGPASRDKILPHLAIPKSTSHKIPAVRSTASIGVFVSLTFKKARNIKKSRLFLPLKTWWVASSDVCQTGYALWIRAKSFYSAHMRYEKRLVKPVGLTTRKGGEYDQSG